MVTGASFGVRSQFGEKTRASGLVEQRILRLDIIGAFL